MADINYRAIGVIHSPFTSIEGMPIQPSGGEGIRGTVELYPEFAPGLKDVAGFSHLILIYHFHRSHGYDLELKPFLDDTVRGVFATRAPRRPNPIGLSVVELVRVDGCTLHIENVDILDGTPLLDIKPHVSAFELVRDERTGWLSQRAEEAQAVKSDKRFR
jgi:tRNA (adenine37-N6)-methyltransferase